MSCFRTHLCGTLSQADEESKIELAGWVNVRRDLGGLIFIELRDHTGRVQLVSDPKINPEIHQIFETLRAEYVIQVKGKISTRPEGNANPDLRSGAIEIYPESVKILNKAKIFSVAQKDLESTDENYRLKNRVRDLRNNKLQESLRSRHKISQAIREYLNKDNFIEIETPILTKSTPEGARDYLVPSRIHPGNFFALPQSPQLFKQLLVTSGFEGYYQFARCFRDEDLRADRQPEFTQIDLELGFTDQAEVILKTENLLKAAFSAVDHEIETPIKKITYQEAIQEYGSDKPDLRFGLKLIDFTDLMAKSKFKSFAQVAQSQNGLVKAICVENTGNWTRKEFDNLRDLCVRDFGAKGLAWISYNQENPLGQSPISKFFEEKELKLISQKACAKPGDTVFFIADLDYKTNEILGRLRLYLANYLNLIDSDADSLVWVVDWPLLTEDPETKELAFMNHPFTQINPEDKSLLETDCLKVRALAYDIVYNGVELGGGSIRNHKLADQIKAFELLGITPEKMKTKFGFLLDALETGAPPHGGIALGLDRIVMMLLKLDSLRDVIAFPKIQSSTCLLTKAPSEVGSSQLKDLGVKVVS